MALKYKLDDLGWVDFEELVQSLLIARLGSGVESWGKNGDWGRDAFFNGKLRYPSIDLSNGPFLFQCKFVESANAAGARPTPAILKAIQAEAMRIRERSPKIAGFRAKHYVLFSNAIIRPELRQKIEGILRPLLETCDIHIHDGRDICNWINLSPSIASSFPQLFTIRDLREFLLESVNADILSRSKVAISMASDSAKVFVPTSAYFEAIARLKQHSFVVLEGPPEMGKTTIARMIALSRLKEKWEAIECKSPKDFHRAYNARVPQVFVADDFFGRTEYEPSRISRWNDELSFILRQLDTAHWLILTSRAHLLKMGKHDLDIPDFNNKFPKLGEVLVHAGNLSVVERAKILYRHAKIASLSQTQKDALKSHAPDIVDHEHYTPLRVKNLIQSLKEAEHG